MDDAIYFWNADQPNGELSQWYRQHFTVNDKTYPTPEHYMMCAKVRLFGDLATEGKILEEENPEKVWD